MARLEVRVLDPCTAVHETGRAREREAGHPPGRHWYTVWAFDPESGENYPSYPVEWSTA